MKRTLVLLTAACLAATAAHGAGAATKAPKPVTATYYFHGVNALGNQDQAGLPGSLMTADKKKPTGTSDKNFVFYGLGASPNTQCAGNSLFPNWIAPATGNLTGTAKVTIFGQGSGVVKVQIFADVEAQACNEAYPTPLGEVSVTLPAAPGPVTVSIPIAKFGKSPGKVSSSFTVQLLPTLVPPSVQRAIYDSAASPSSVTVTCIPKVGKKTC
ncbi:MAG: hypothetical protein QOK42_554 [Frankiaceae bacterium]|jgi:hypothetical protein|nr:hypothetical protein [Frankiaceae bacterium]MDX6224392.1 hypothetical protein [Frankiales bacterium]MDX6274788.1 hypothetical protein [Frankiales bacterium]